MQHNYQISQECAKELISFYRELHEISEVFASLPSEKARAVKAKLDREITTIYSNIPLSATQDCPQDFYEITGHAVEDLMIARENVSALAETFPDRAAGDKVTAKSLSLLLKLPSQARKDFKKISEPVATPQEKTKVSNSKKKNKIKKVKLAGGVRDRIFELTDYDWSAVNAIIAEIRLLDKDLSDEVESIVIGSLCQATIEGFYVGRECERKPELLISEDE